MSFTVEKRVRHFILMKIEASTVTVTFNNATTGAGGPAGHVAKSLDFAQK